MNLPETCPFCGAEPYTTASGNQCRGGDQWVLFSCDTSIYAGQDLRWTQSRKCEDAERARLSARVAELEARCKRLEEAARAVYIDSIASDHPWSELETRNMHALRDALEDKP